jgi:ribose transport system ATP-binding protein
MIASNRNMTKSSSGTAPPEEELAIYVKNANKSFGVTRALNDVSFRASFGEIQAIIGGNGCGKSTMAKVLAGVLKVDSGEVSIMGHAPTTPSDARKMGVAMVFQEVMVADEATIAENLYAGADSLWAKAMPNSEKIARSRVLMRELVGSDVDPQRLAAGLSLGVKAWITIGRALLSRPKILILDESSAALDFDSTERLFTKIRELRDNGTAVLIVTHRIAELIRICDRATVMRDGRNVGVLSKSEITESNLLGLMAGKTETRKTPEAAGYKALASQVVLKTSNLKVWPNAEPVNFDLRRGEIIGVTGLEGQGQDPFVRILAGTADSVESYPIAETGGSGSAAEIRDLQSAKANGIEFVSGDRKREGILPNLSIFENLLCALYPKHKFGSKLSLINWPELEGIFNYEVQRLSIKTGPQSNLITSLSGGNQQKVLIGRAFSLRPKILILNDPARGIDVGTKREFYQHLRDFADEGNSVVYMSSELEEFIGLCSRVAVFRNGSIFDTLTDADVHPRLILESMFGQTRGAKAAAKANRVTPVQAAPRALAAEVPRFPSQSASAIRIVTSEKAPMTKAPALDPMGRPIKIRYF